MKPTRLSRLSRLSRHGLLTAAIASLLAGASAQAADYYWTANGTSGTLGGTGDWHTLGTWAQKDVDGTTWIDPVGDWNNDGTALALFTNASGTTTMNANVNAQGILLNVGQTIEGSGTLTIGADGVSLSIANAHIATNIIGENLVFTLTNSTLTLSGDNAGVTGESTVQFSSTTKIMQLASANALGASIVILSGTGGILNLGNGSAENISYNASELNMGSTTSLIAANEGVSTWTGTVLPTGTSTVLGTIENSAAQLVVNGDVSLSSRTITAATSNSSLGIEINGVVSGTGNITTSGTQRLALGGANTFTGALNLTQNTAQLALTNVDALKAATLDTKTSGTQTVTFGVAGTNTYNIGALAGSDDLAIGANTLSIGAKTSVASLYAGIMSGTGGGLTKVGSNTLTLTNANTYSGLTSIKSGTLSLTTGNNRLNTAGSMVLGDTSTAGKLVLGTSTLAVNQTLAGLTTTGSGGNVVGAHATNNSILTLDIASGTNTYGGILGGAGTNENKLALTKTGSGTLALTSANTYSGDTLVSAGTLAVNNTTTSGTGTGTVKVGGDGSSSTPTLAGTGTISGATTIAAAGTGLVGTHSPGSLLTNNGIGIQTFGSTLTYESGSIFEWQLGSNTEANRGTAYDAVNVTNSSVTIATDAKFKIVLGSSVDFNGVDNFWDSDRSWQVFGSSAASIGTGSFLVIDAPTTSYSTYYPYGGFTFDNTAGTLNWTAVPEPSTALAGLLLAAGLLRRRRNA
jgi:autotransporter-associated beta strand protein